MHFGVFRAPRMCLVGTIFVQFLMNKICKLKQVFFFDILPHLWKFSCSGYFNTQTPHSYGLAIGGWLWAECWYDPWVHKWLFCVPIILLPDLSVTCYPMISDKRPFEATSASIHISFTGLPQKYFIFHKQQKCLEETTFWLNGCSQWSLLTEMCRSGRGHVCGRGPVRKLFAMARAWKFADSDWRRSLTQARHSASSPAKHSEQMWKCWQMCSISV